MGRALRWAAGLFALFCVTSAAPARGEIELPPSKSNEAIRAYNNGVRKLNERQYGEAISAMDQALSHDDQFAEAYFLRAVCRQSTNSLGAALSDLDQAIQLKPALTDAHALRGAIRYEKDQWDGALEDFTYVLARKPSDGQSLVGRGIIRLNRKDPSGAAHDLRAFVKRYPTNPLTPKVREILAAIQKEAGPEAPASANAGEHEEESPSAPTRSRRASAVGGRSAADLARGLMRREGSLSEKFGQNVVRGERREVAGDLSAAGAPTRARKAQQDDSFQIVEPH